MFVIVLLVLSLKLPSPVISLPSSLHWLRITERIEYKLLSLTYKVLRLMCVCFFVLLIVYLMCVVFLCLERIIKMMMMMTTT